MSESGTQIDRHAVDLLFRILDMPRPVLTAAAADMLGADRARPLIDAGLLEAAGHERAWACTSDHDDVPIALAWSAQHQAYGYFSPSAGWVTVPSELLKVFQVGFDQLFARLFDGLDLQPRSPPIELIANLLWELGEVRLPGRSKRVSMWIARRLSDRDAWSRFLNIARLRPAPGLRVVLSMSPADRLPNEVCVGHSIVAVPDVADRDGLMIDPELLAVRIDSGRQTSSDPIVMTADGASITVNGKRYGFSGSKQRAVIRHLYQAWHAREPVCVTAEVLETAGYSCTVNTVAKAFSGRTDWRNFIGEAGGRCWMFH